MRKSLLFLLNTLLAAATLCVVSCGIDDVDAEDGAIQFELYDTEGTLIEGLQSMKFGATTAYTLKSAFVTYTEVTAPAGWKCSVIPSSRSCTVTAPVASDLEAEAGGDITIAITSQAGRTMSYTLSVAALEESISLTFDGEATTKNHIFSYGKSRVFPFSCENTSSLEVEAPEGWTTETDLENNQLTVTAPMPDSQNPTLTGAVKVTPLSVRGTAGESSSISVELSTKMPVIQFSEPIDRFVFGEQRDIPCTMQYVDKCDITAPEGWTVELDIAASMLKVTAPAEGVGIPAGTVTLDAVSAEELTESFETQLSLKGIATGDDFVAFGKAVTEAAPLDEFMQEGTVILLQDVDLSAFSQTCFVGQAENPFTGTFDGKGHTLTVSLNDGDAKELGLFHTLDATAAVKNLTLAGSMTISKIDPVTAGMLAVFNNGAALTGVTNTAAITFSGLKTSSTMGNLGGLGVGGEFFVRREKREVLFVEVVDPAERGAVRNGEGQRPHADAQFLFHLVQQVERLLGGAVEFVDEDDHRRRTHTAHLHQFAGLRLDALGTVDDDDDRIDGRQRAVGVFGEVLVARGVEDVDLGALVFEAHHGRGDRDAALALDLHEVRRGAFLDLVAFDRPGDVDGTAEEQQLLGEGGFTRVGVGDDREGAAACDFFL